MIQPVLGAIEAYLVIYNNMPMAVRNFVALSLFFFLTYGCVSLFKAGD